jgi:glycosyltransferase involved in cell wall biosynthesis
MNYPKISIVTPSYNQGQYIEQTILSIINQNYPNLEYIIIDGGSTDNTVEIIRKYEKHITYWVSEKDKGQSEAINKGLAKCTGEIFNWINSDDYLEENSLWVIGKLFAEKQPDMLMGYLRVFDEDNKEKEQICRATVQENAERELIFHEIVQPSTFYSMNIIKNLGNQVAENLRCVMDLDLWWRFRFCFPNSKIIYTDELLAHFRHHSTSKSVSEFAKFRTESLRLTYSLLKKIQVKPFYMRFFVAETEFHKEIEGVLQKILVKNININRVFEIYFSQNFYRKESFLRKLYVTFAYILYNPNKSYITYKRIILDYLFSTLYQKLKN